MMYFSISCTAVCVRACACACVCVLYVLITQWLPLLVAV